jgi:predicted Zn-dependent peptidase
MEKIKSIIKMLPSKNQVRRVYNKEQSEISQKRIEKEMDVSMPIVMLAYKDNDLESKKVRKDLAIDILNSLLLSRSSELYKKLYEEGKIFSEPGMNYEFSKTYAHVLIQAQTNYVEEFIEEFSKNIEKIKSEGVATEDFERIKRKIYGEIVKDYNDISTISNGLISDSFKNIKPFEYFEEFDSINKEYVEEVLKDIFVEDRKVISIIKPINEG